MTSLGFSRPIAYAIALSSVNIALGIAAIVGFYREGHPLTWDAFAKRMRLTAMRGRDWLWVVGGILVFGIGALLVNNLILSLFTAINFKMINTGDANMDILTSVIVLFFNIFGEEFWWRGYILPRQELAFGKTTWLLHGALWACFHMFKWWAVPAMLITCQVIPFIAQRTKNTWPGIISHFIVNGAGLLLSAL